MFAFLYRDTIHIYIYIYIYIIVIWQGNPGKFHRSDRFRTWAVFLFKKKITLIIVSGRKQPVPAVVICRLRGRAVDNFF